MFSLYTTPDTKQAGGASAAKRAAKKAPRKGSYESMTVEQLKAKAKKAGMKGYSSLKKADLIKAMRARA